MATLRNINIPSVSSALDIPEIPTNFVNTKIPCGQNIALNTLRDVQDQIKDKLASGKGGLGALGDLIKKGQDALLVVQEKINEFYSFQADINSIKNDPSPANIAQVLQRYKGKVPDLDRYIQLASDITNTTPFDVCAQIPNIKIDIDTGSVTVDAKDSITPNEGPLDSIPLVSTVKDFFKDTSQSPSGISLDRLQEYKTEVPEEIQKQVLDPAQEKQREKIEEYLTQEKVVKNQGIAEKTKKYGKTYQELKETGLLTVDEIKSIDSLKSQEIKTSLYKAIPSWLIQYSDSEQMALIETASESEKTAIKQSYLDIFEGNADSTAYPEEAAFYQSSLAKIDSIREVNKQLILDYVAHNKYLSPSDTESANAATKNLVSLKEAPIHINTVARPTNQRGFV